MQAPKFWDKQECVLSKVLKPFGWIYAWTVARRFKKVKPYQAAVPVICVGNVSVGGTGKTPVSLAIAKLLKEKEHLFYFLNHGYKTRLKHVLVDLTEHTAFDVGDEAMLLAFSAPTVVDNNRARGAQLAVKMGAPGIIMDDGFQNPGLIKTLSFVVVDGKKGFGNEQVLPAGPLREPVLKALERADAVIIAGEDTWGVRFYLQRHQKDLPILTGKFVPNPTQAAKLKGRKVFAFAGIGNPQKFYDLLRSAGALVMATCDFPDHYFYTRFDIEQLKEKASKLTLVTTAKDAVKISGPLRAGIDVLDGEFVFDEPESVWELLKGAVEHGQE